MATLSSVLAWRIPWTGEPGGLQSLGSQSQTQLKQLGTHAPYYVPGIWIEVSKSGKAEPWEFSGLSFKTHEASIRRVSRRLDEGASSGLLKGGGGVLCVQAQALLDPRPAATGSRTWRGTRRRRTAA